MSDPSLPPATRDLAARRRALAPKAEDAFCALS